MIRRGKAEGWFRLQPAALQHWASFNGVDFRGVEVRPLAGRGSSVVACSNYTTTSSFLISVPGELVLSKENVHLLAKSDRFLREVLESSGDFGNTSRGAILIFLLLQATYSCPDLQERIGVSTPFTEYVKFLPLEPLPTFWSAAEAELLVGTSLAPALDSKLTSLHREFDALKNATEHIQWCKDCWWDEVDGLLQFDDWLQVDAMYRSRALEFPGIGDAMVPCLDMANHASGVHTKALYETDDAGNSLLIAREPNSLQQGEEVTITYGDEKGACEMIFSYGFLEADVEDARDIYLELQIPDEDPLKRAKQAVSTTAPGVRLISSPGGELSWESEYIWLVCVNEEDGLAFQIAVTTDGERELKVAWKGQDLSETSSLRSFLETDALWEVYRLRAIVLLQNRVEQQLVLLQETSHVEAQDNAANAFISEGPRSLAIRLRQLEGQLLERFYEFFEEEKLKLVETEAVKTYLSAVQDGAVKRNEDDFT